MWSLIQKTLASHLRDMKNYLRGGLSLAVGLLAKNLPGLL